jgi:hypothetical protein
MAFHHDFAKWRSPPGTMWRVQPTTMCFDLHNLCLPQDFSDSTGVKKMLSTVPIRRPGPNGIKLGIILCISVSYIYYIWAVPMHDRHVTSWRNEETSHT